MVKPVYSIVIKKQNSKQKDRFFVVVDRYLATSSSVGGVGYWTYSAPQATDEVKKELLEEVFIPWYNIDCVRSLVYRPKF